MGIINALQNAGRGISSTSRANAMGIGDLVDQPNVAPNPRTEYIKGLGNYARSQYKPGTANKNTAGNLIKAYDAKTKALGNKIK